MFVSCLCNKLSKFLNKIDRLHYLVIDLFLFRTKWWSSSYEDFFHGLKNNFSTPEWSDKVF